MLRHVVKLGHPALVRRAAPVTGEMRASGRLQALVESLKTTMAEQGGVGLAAPQINESLAVFVVEDSREPSKVHVLINPEIRKASSETDVDIEGCLSIPGVLAHVERPSAVDVAYEDETGRRIEAKWSGFMARVFQHEHDHLEGLTFFDRITSPAQLMMEEEFERRQRSRGADAASDSDSDDEAGYRGFGVEPTHHAPA